VTRGEFAIFLFAFSGLTLAAVIGTIVLHQMYLRRILKYAFEDEALAVTLFGRRIVVLRYDDIADIVPVTLKTYARVWLALNLTNRGHAYDGAFVSIKRKQNWFMFQYVWISPDDPPSFIAELNRRMVTTCAFT
jgi:hypothetical protein